MAEKMENESNWERAAIEKLAFAALQEQKRARYWGIFFKLLGFAYLTVIVLLAWDWRGGEHIADAPHTALVELNGVIEARGDASSDRINTALQSAFKDKNTKGVVLRINSPGGSPVQSSLITDEILRQRKLHPNIPLYAVVEDVCASGGYFVAAAADRIYVNRSSIVGSIGVLMDGFGFTGTMDKLGVERRLMTAGENKGFLDPFSPVSPGQKQHAQDMLGQIHQHFIDTVRKGRGKRLKETPDMFSGLMWTGEKSVELGLTDAFGSLDQIARDVIKAEEIVDFSQRENLAERFAKRLGAGMGKSLANVIGDRLVSIR